MHARSDCLHRTLSAFPPLSFPHLQTLAIDPHYSTRRTKEVATGGLAGQLVLSSQVGNHGKVDFAGLVDCKTCMLCMMADIYFEVNGHSVRVSLSACQLVCSLVKHQHSIRGRQCCS